MRYIPRLPKGRSFIMRRVVALIILGIACTGLLGLKAMAQTSMENRLEQMVEQRQFIQARALALELSKEYPKRFTGPMYLAIVLHQGEGDLPRAYYYYKKAEGLNKEHPNELNSMVRDQLLFSLYYHLQACLGEMDRYEEQLKSLDKLVEVCRKYGDLSQRIKGAYAWPLMKLDRFDEAHKMNNNLALFQDKNSQLTYYNSRSSIFSEEGEYERSAATLEECLDKFQSNGWIEEEPVIRRNLGEAYAHLGRVEEAEQRWLEATKIFNPNSYSNPWSDLAYLYLNQGRIMECTEAIQRMDRWTLAIEPYLRQQSYSEKQVIRAELMMQLGLPERAYQIMKIVINQPDRTGGTSISQEQKEAGNYNMYANYIIGYQRYLEEKLTWTDGFEWWSTWWELSQLDWTLWQAESRTGAVLEQDHLLDRAFYSCYHPEVLTSMDWHRVALFDILGDGIATAILHRSLKDTTARVADNDLNLITFWLGEAYFRSGDYDKARKLFAVSLKDIDSSWHMLVGLAQVREAQMVLAEQGLEAAVSPLSEAYQTAPVLLRQLGVALPLVLRGGSEAQQFVEGALIDSGRFQEASSGFSIQVDGTIDNFTVTLLGPNNNNLVQVSLPLPPPSEDTPQEQEETRPQKYRILEQAFAQIFAPSVDFSQLNVSSLDGSNATSKSAVKDIANQLGL